MSAKRRRYRELREAEGKAEELVSSWRSDPIRRFQLTDAEHALLASWRADAAPGFWNPGESRRVEDPTSAELEPDLRTFEEHGDPPP